MNQSNVTTQPSLSTRVKVWFDRLPFVTRVVLVVCLGIYAAGALIGFDDYGKICLSADRVLWHGEVWRFLTAAVFHMGALHVGFNMLAFVPIGMSLERALGSVSFAWLMLLLVTLGNAAYVFFSFVAAFGPARLGGEWVRQCAVGLSGVVFGLIVADNAASRATHRSIFGLFSVPAVTYPWALLVFWQLVMPGASFLGHLCGVLVGQLYEWGLLKWLLPSERVVRAIESSRACGPCYAARSFVAASGPAAAATGGAPPLPVSFVPTGSAGGGASEQQQQQGSWLTGGWLRLPGSDASDASTGGAGGGGSGSGGGGGLFGLGGSHGTAGAPFAGRGRTIGATDRALPQGVPAYAANAGLSAAPPLQRPPTYPAGPNIASGPSAGGTAGSTLQTAPASSQSSGGRKLDPDATALPAATARAAAAAAAEARARRFSATDGGGSGGGSAHAAAPPTRPASLPSSPPTGGSGSAGSHSLRTARSADTGTLDRHPELRDSAAMQGPGSAAAPRPTALGQQGPTSQAALQQLLAMGFMEAAAHKALVAAGGNISAAVELLSSD